MAFRLCVGCWSCRDCSTGCGASRAATSSAISRRPAPSSARAPLARHQGPCPAALPHRRGGAALQRPAEAHLLLGVIFVLLPRMVLTGLTMSPGMDAAWPWLLDLFGGRQSARSIHFICAMRAGRLHRRPPGDGGAGRADQRAALDDHRPVPPAAEKARMSDHVLTRRGLIGSLGARRRRAAARRLRPDRAVARASRTLLGRGERADAARAAPRQRPHARWRREFARADMSPIFRANGTTMPPTPTIRRTPRPASPTGGWWSTAWSSGRCRCRSPQIRAMPARTQITRHDCVEGWSAIGKWTGVAARAAARRWRGCCRRARYIVFHCADDFDGDALLREHRPDRRLPSADHPRLGHERPAAVASPTARRCACGSSASSATSRPSMSCASRRSTSLAGIGGGKGGYWEDSPLSVVRGNLETGCPPPVRG